MAELAWLGAVRHGQSTGNAAAYEAELAGWDTVRIDQRDADVPLSPLGRTQAQALGEWLRGWPRSRWPETVLTSPFCRAAGTAEAAVAGMGLVLVPDERLRDRELGVLDRLTSHGVAQHHPDELARRQHLGTFYYRPPGGEAWTDVALRLRGFLGDVRREYPDQRVLLFAHEAVVLLLRYLIEGLTEAEVVALAGAGVPNASLTSWRRLDGRLQLAGANEVAHLSGAGAPG